MYKVHKHKLSGDLCLAVVASRDISQSSQSRGDNCKLRVPAMDNLPIKATRRESEDRILTSTASPRGRPPRLGSISQCADSTRRRDRPMTSLCLRCHTRLRRISRPPLVRAEVPIKSCSSSLYSSRWRIGRQGATSSKFTGGFLPRQRLDKVQLALRISESRRPVTIILQPRLRQTLTRMTRLT